jgi:hypothetical protein
VVGWLSRFIGVAIVAAAMLIVLSQFNLPSLG